MAQGKARNKDEVIATLQPFFQLGCSVKKACDYAGIPYSTVDTWVQNDDDLRVKITAWQNEMSAMARKNIKDALGKGNISVSSEWLTKKEKDEFSERHEHTGADGEKLFNEEATEKAGQAIGSFLENPGDTGKGE